ncbi:MAG TPA: hypothetical protein IGS17_00570 [Oscillatoriales cyanobacterium M59_W2019_021]|nr:hypothetical protein [Oscillatoriales cyanobacterium M4454_W2019_049]HIK49410.1 hypothetical protein [Oscillatoriales cyanobacterium M59_W2019_021]
MATTFKNIVWTTSGTQGEIQTVSEWKVWLCKEKRWSGVPLVVLRNILLAALHPTTEFCIGEISKTEKDPRILNSFSPPTSKETFYLDLASNSRTHGRFTFADRPVGSHYYGNRESWKRIIYGSILHTGLRGLRYKVMRYVVVDDERRVGGASRDENRNGNPQDDPTNRLHWETGESHGKCSRWVMQAFREDSTDATDTPIQFRAALWKDWVAKGTLAYSPLCDDRGIDLVIPISCLKGNKPDLGNYEGKVLIGLVHEAEVRRAKPGWMLFQWFSFETLQQDGIIDRLSQKCQQLAGAWNNIVALAEILRIEQSIAEAELSNPDDNVMSEAEYENTMIRIIGSDRHGLLLLHPYVVRRVQQRMAAMWLNLAKAAGVRFFSVMCQPDESLAHYFDVLPNGELVGERVFCAPDFEPGEYIVFCNPMRHWGDCQLWENRHEGSFADTRGTLTAPRLLLLDLGRDTDGDFIQLIRSSAYPAMREAISNFGEKPTVRKLPKVSKAGTLQQIAIGSMNDLTGVVASLLGRARAVGAEFHQLLIPAGGEQKEANEMRIIDFLSQELQIAVDSLKSAYPNNEPGLRAVTEYLDSIDANIPWLSDFKNPECYRDRACQVDAAATDTISRLVGLVNSHWRAPDLRVDTNPKNYQSVLFGDVPFTDEQKAYARSHLQTYRQEMAEAIAWKEANEGDTTVIRYVSIYARLSKETILAVEPKQSILPRSRYAIESWVSAYWNVCHEAQSGDAGLVFTIWSDEIIARLEGVELVNLQLVEVYGCQHGAWSAPGWRWRGEVVDTRVVLKDGRLAIEMKWDRAQKLVGYHQLGLIGEKYKAQSPPGQTRSMKIWTIRVKNNLSSTVYLFDLSVSDEEIKRQLDLLG